MTSLVYVYSLLSIEVAVVFHLLNVFQFLVAVLPGLLLLLMIVIVGVMEVKV